MSWAWLIPALVALAAVMAATRLLRRLVQGFALAMGGLLLLHMQAAPGEAAAGLGALAGGLVLARPLRRMIFGGLG